MSAFAPHIAAAHIEHPVYYADAIGVLYGMLVREPAHRHPPAWELIEFLDWLPPALLLPRYPVTYDEWFALMDWWADGMPHYVAKSWSALKQRWYRPVHP